MNTDHRATLWGSGAVGLWAVLALLTKLSGPMPPFQMSAICFALGAVIGLPKMLRHAAALRALPARAWALGLYGIFGYHFFYFTALSYAPAAQASLIAYLWPLLIVIFSAALPGESLRRAHIIGAVIGFGGAAVLLIGPGQVFQTAALPGYVAAGFCAMIWSSYSVLSRAMGGIPTAAIGLYCAGSALLALICHLMFEVTVWPATTANWLALGLLGLGPVGLAFYLWDFGVKRGNIQLLGVLAYAAPVLSTLVLVAAGLAPPSLSLLAAAIMITIGAYWAARA